MTILHRIQLGDVVDIVFDENDIDAFIIATSLKYFGIDEKLFELLRTTSISFRIFIERKTVSIQQRFVLSGKVRWISRAKIYNFDEDDPKHEELILKDLATVIKNHGF